MNTIKPAPTKNLSIIGASPSPANPMRVGPVTSGEETPRIYVACLASYNNGYLYGQWINANQKPEDLHMAVQAMLKASPIPDSEEFAIHNFENFYGYDVHEYTSLETVSKLAAFITAYGELDAHVLEAYDDDIDTAIVVLKDRYMGAYDDVTDYLQESVEQTEGGIPDCLDHYIKWGDMARDWRKSGDITVIECAGQVHLFTP